MERVATDLDVVVMLRAMGRGMESEDHGECTGDGAVSTASKAETCQAGGRPVVDRTTIGWSIEQGRSVVKYEKKV